MKESSKSKVVHGSHMRDSTAYSAIRRNHGEKSWKTRQAWISGKELCG